MKVSSYGFYPNGQDYVYGQAENGKKPSKAAMLGGFLAGGMTYNVVNTSIKTPIVVRCMSKIKNMGNGLSNSEFEAIKDAAEKVIKTSGLKDKGVSILKVTSQNKEEIEKLLKSEFRGNLVTRFLPKTIIEKLAKDNASVFVEGKNAAYIFKNKKLLMPEGKGLSWAVFHEAGHAMNANFSKVGRILQKSRPLMLLAVPIALIALLKNKKPDGVKPEGTLDKTTTFIKENAGKLTFATFLPTLIEEGMASIKGNKFASKFLNPELAKKVAKANKMAYLTYLGTAVAASVAIYAGKKVRDSIVHKKAVKA